MRISNLYSVRVEAFAYAIMIIGVLGDHISTNVGLSRFSLQESNPIALSLMNNNVWIQADIILIMVSITGVYAFQRLVKSPSSRIILLLPIICGLVRLGVAFWNASLILG